VTLSVSRPLTKHLFDQVAGFVAKTHLPDQLQVYFKAVQTLMNKYFPEEMNSKLADWACFLDPRFKNSTQFGRGWKKSLKKPVVKAIQEIKLKLLSAAAASQVLPLSSAVAPAPPTSQARPPLSPFWKILTLLLLHLLKNF
jgi:hypothetical protein